MEVEEAQTGDIVAISGIPDITIGETVADAENPIALPILNVEEPTIQINVSVNNSPFAGKEGEYKTSREIRARLYKELGLFLEKDLRMASIKSSIKIKSRTELP